MARTTDSDLLPQELRVLVAVADTGAFSAAAGTLGTTQSAVSHSVRGSERKIGAVLFERGRAGARPTPAGERAVAHARRVLRLLDVLTAEARDAARPDTARGNCGSRRSAARHSTSCRTSSGDCAPDTPGSSHGCGSSASWGAAPRAKSPTGRPTWPSPHWAAPSRFHRAWSPGNSSKSRMPSCTRRATGPRAPCRWSTGPRTAAREPATGGPRRTGSRRRPSRPRTTVRCSPW